MINVTFSFAFAEVPFHFIPKFFWEKEKNIRRLTVFWLTGCIVIDNDKTARVGKDIYYQAALTAILDSYTKSSEIVDIMNENNSDAVGGRNLANRVNPVVSDEDAERILAANRRGHFLDNCAVVFVR